jgi:mono/diheme cytochrome c family protein
MGCGGDQILTAEQEPDPVVVDVPIAFIKRPAPLDEDSLLVTQDLRIPNDFLPGAQLFIKARASVSAIEINISDRAFFTETEILAATDTAPLAGYDVKDLSVSYDGNRLLFAMRAPEIEDVDDDEQPSWNIWEYDLTADSLSRIIASDLGAEFGQDTSPTYLPDARIVFSSTRQQANQALLLDEGKPQYQALDENRVQIASVLHVMDADGSNIQQISFNQSHDLNPVVLSSGKIIFSRWDNVANNNSINIYQMNADGSGLEIVYGRHSHNSELTDDTLQFTQLTEQPNGELLAAIRPFVSNSWGGEYVNIDISNYIDNTMPVASQSGLNGPAQESALFDNILIDGSISPGGLFAAVYPLWDNSQRLLFSWSQCRVYNPEQVLVEGDVRIILPCDAERLANPQIEAAPLLFGLWMFDPIENTQLVINVPEESQFYTDVVAMQARAFPADAQQAEEFDQDLANKNLGRVHIKSVYDFAGTDVTAQGIAVMADPTQTPIDDRPARFLRVVKAVSIPTEAVRDFDNSAFGRSRNQLMREIIGYVPIQPDGSVYFEAPANVPLTFSILDVNGRRVGERHQNWLQLAAGEVRTCNGCHSQDSEAPHGRADAEADSINLGAANTGSPFLNTNPALFADLGDTMAQTSGRINGISYPSQDINFADIWTDPAMQTPAPSFVYSYGDLQSSLPITAACAINWTSLCRIQIHFPEHIQPLFSLDRQVFDEDGLILLEDQSCLSCHTPEGEDGLAQIPAAQLDLRATPSTDNADFLSSYRELMFGDNEQELLEGVLLDRLVIVTDQNGDTVFELDEEGELILDAEGNAIPVTQTVAVRNSMSVNGAHSSNRFFTPFNSDGTHEGWLTPAELKLLSEWLDIGGQYYNDPFTAPVN